MKRWMRNLLIEKRREATEKRQIERVIRVRHDAGRRSTAVESCAWEGICAIVATLWVHTYNGKGSQNDEWVYEVIRAKKCLC